MAAEDAQSRTTPADSLSVPIPASMTDPAVASAIAVLSTRLAALTEAWQAQRVDDRRALELQAAEYSRRLDDLNGAHQNAVAVQGTYVPRETYATFVTEIRTQLGSLRDRMDTMVIEATRQSGAIAANSAEIASLNASLTWVIRVVIGAVILALLGLIIVGRVRVGA